MRALVILLLHLVEVRLVEEACIELRKKPKKNSDDRRSPTLS